jgi:hypothetical protein
MTDYPAIRRDTTCPICRKPKDHGLVACWPCYRGHGLRNGESAWLRDALLNREAELTMAAEFKVRR